MIFLPETSSDAGHLLLKSVRLDLTDHFGGGSVCPPLTENGFIKATNLIVGANVPQLHDELEAQEVVGADGLQLQQAAQRHQLGAGQVVQRQLVLKQFGEAQDLLVAGTLARAADLGRRKSKIERAVRKTPLESVGV